MVFWPPEWPTCHYSVRKKEEGCREVLTETRNRAGRPCRGGGIDGERRRTDGVHGLGWAGARGTGRLAGPAGKEGWAERLGCASTKVRPGNEKEAG
jgi:hypothetical protein